MRENAGQVRGRRGRPRIRPDDETRRLVVEAAAQEFRANGYAATSMAAVAERAGVSTKTVYRLIPTKADLFRSVVSDRIGRFILEVDADTLESLPPVEALERLLRAYGELTLAAETTAIIRLVLAEGHRFPELAATFHEVAILRTTEAIASWLRRQCRRGLIELEDAEEAAGMLRGMMSMEPQRAVMLGRRAVPRRAEIAARARTCARIFLHGCGARQAC
jgi:AcrR family transcriptional regulator